MAWTDEKLRFLNIFVPVVSSNYVHYKYEKSVRSFGLFHMLSMSVE